MRFEANSSIPNLSWKIWPLLAIALSVAGCALTDADAKKAKADGQAVAEGKVRKVQPNEPNGDKKAGTGLSFKGQTRVDTTPMPAAAPGWFSEAVASGEDDWEPAIAVDPGNANFVYQLVTRYTGPKPCGKLQAARDSAASLDQRRRHLDGAVAPADDEGAIRSADHGGHQRQRARRVSQRHHPRDHLPQVHRPRRHLGVGQGLGGTGGEAAVERPSLDRRVARRPARLYRLQLDRLVRRRVAQTAGPPGRTR
jgi:hypothetical protein